MAKDQFSKIAYKTLQQGKSIAGLAHKELSTRIMNFVLPDNKLGNFKIDKKLLVDIQNSMDRLRDCLLYTSPSPRDGLLSRMPSSA